MMLKKKNYDVDLLTEWPYNVAIMNTEANIMFLGTVTQPIRNALDNMIRKYLFNMIFWVLQKKDCRCMIINFFFLLIITVFSIFPQILKIGAISTNYPQIFKIFSNLFMFWLIEQPFWVEQSTYMHVNLMSLMKVSWIICLEGINCIRIGTEELITL